MSETQDAGARGRGARTREAAQRVALRLFTEQGYEATSLRQIADELGINKASLYYHFDGKEAIVQSLLDHAGNKIRAARALGMSRATIYRRIREYGIVTS